MGKGKVHPSPPALAAGGETEEAVLLRLLSAAVLAMAAPLEAEGKVLAYLILASLRSSAPLTPAREEVEGAGSGRKAHPPELGCRCFRCYMAYWSRWGGSPERNREAIHCAIEATEEHLNKKEEGKGGRRRKKHDATTKGKAGKGKELVVVEPPSPSPPPTKQEETSAVAVLVNVDEGGEEANAEEEATTAGGGSDSVEEDRRR